LLADPPVATPSEVSPEQLCHCSGEDDGTAVLRIRQILASPLHEDGLELADTPLDQALNLIQTDYELPIQVDRRALEDSGIGGDDIVIISVRNVSVGAALRLLLNQLDLTYAIRDEVLMITTPEEAETQLLACVYVVRDLVARPGQPLDFKPLIDTIISCVATETWAENGGGEAYISHLDPGLVVITQTQAVHAEINSLLNSLRNARRKITDSDAQVSYQAEKQEVLSKGYRLNLNESAVREKAGEKLVMMIQRLVPGAADEKSSDGQKYWIDNLPDRIVVRHRREVHEQVQQLLSDLGVLAETDNSAVAGAGFGGGGF
jgi:hypothetical protein